MTSQNVVSYVKRILKADKAGHTGTLDPGASGVLPVCLGKATRVSEYLLNDKKSYRAEFQIGLRSNTLDKYGDVEEVEMPSLSSHEIYKAIESFKGRIEQLPPMFSAVKQCGKKLYELAREGITVDRELRKVIIYDINILYIKKNKVLFDVTCSKGTYIRSLCSDIGRLLSSDAIMTFLLRTKTGPFSINDSITLNELNDALNSKCLDDIIKPIHTAMVEYDRVFIDSQLSKKVMNGVGFRFDSCIKYEQGSLNDVVLIFDSYGSFIAVGKRCEKGEYIKIHKVFS